MADQPKPDDRFDDLVDEILSEKPAVSRQSPAKANPGKLSEMPLVTTESYVVHGRHIEETLPMVTARCVLGANAFKDFAVAVRDAVGGRVQTAEDLFKNAERTVLQELRRKALARKADAITCVRIQVGEVAGRIYYVAAQGTPVRLSENSV